MKNLFTPPVQKVFDDNKEKIISTLTTKTTISTKCGRMSFYKLLDGRIMGDYMCEQAFIVYTPQ